VDERGENESANPRALGTFHARRPHRRCILTPFPVFFLSLAATYARQESARQTARMTNKERRDLASPARDAISAMILSRARKSRTGRSRKT